MNGVLIEVVIALVLAYSLLSIVVSQINDLIVKMGKYRANFLRKELEKIFGDEDLARSILKHPLLRVLKVEAEGRFLKYLLGIVEVEAGTITKHTGVDKIDPKLLALILTDSEEIDTIKDHLPGTALKKALDALKVNGQTAQERIELWVDSIMDDMTKAYRKRVAFYTFAIGLILAFALNVDSVYMAQALWKDPSLRTLTSQTAEKLVSSPTETPAEQQSEEQQDQEQQNGEQQSIDIGPARETIDSLLNSGLPIGWVYYENIKEPKETITEEQRVKLKDQLKNDSRNFRNVFWKRDFWGVVWWDVKKLTGLVITAVAISLGSDFWFNLLRSLVNRGGESQSSDKTEESPAKT